MLYVIVIILAAVGAFVFFRQQNSGKTEQQNQDLPDAQVQEDSQAESGASGESEASSESESESSFILSAKPMTSPDTVDGATYSTHAPAGESSPYGLSAAPEKKAQASSNLLRWCGRTSTIQIEKFVIPGPVAYWANGESSTPEPSCINVELPVEFPQHGQDLPADGAASYAEMSPLQRGIYLTWLSGARIQPPLHICYPSIWLYGIERRAIIDKLDLSLCINEVFRLLPLMRWEVMAENLVNFITWLAIRIWLPEEDMLSLCMRMNTAPENMLCILLNSYANAKLPLPSSVAFTLMRTSAKLRGENAAIMSHSDELLQKFTPIYKEICSGGLILAKPQNNKKILYTPTNPTVKLDKKSSVPLEIPDFFEDTRQFKLLRNSWEVFLTSLTPVERGEVEAKAADSLGERPDFEGFIETLSPEGSNLPLMTTLGNLGDLMKFDTSPEAKITGKQRKSMVDTAQVEGWQIVPDLGISGRNYQWSDFIMFIRLAPGTKLSQAYRISSFLIEFICALVQTDEERLFEPLRQHLNDYFQLTDDDNIRLEAQRLLNLPTQHDAEFYGEFVSMWLSSHERITLKNFILNFLSFLPEFQNNPALKTRTCEILGVRENTDPSPEQLAKTNQELGREILNLMTLLFKNNN